MRGERLRLAILAADTATIPVALVAGYLVRYGSSVRTGLSAPVPWGPLLVVTVAATTWLVLYQPLQLDGFQCGWQLSAVVSRIALGVALVVGAVLTTAYLLRVYYSRLVLTYFALLLFVMILLVRLVAYGALRLRRRAGKTRKLVIVGEGSIARELASRIERHPELLSEVLGFLSPANGSGSQTGESTNGARLLGSLDALEFLRATGVQEVIVALENSPGVELARFLEGCRALGVRISLLPQNYQLYSAHARLVEIDGVPLVSVEAPADLKLAGTVKRAVDLTLGTLLLLPALPVILLAGAALWCQGRRLLRRELRCGWHGEPFHMYRLDVDRDTSDAPALHRFFRQTSLSELPQLFNVLLGQMSLVGPRPEALERVRDYSEWQRQRLRIRPGMTGLAQVNGLREQHPSEEKTRYDLQYMLNWTPVTDLVLLLQTVWALAARRGWRDGGVNSEPQPAKASGGPSAPARSLPH